MDTAPDVATLTVFSVNGVKDVLSRLGDEIGAAAGPVALTFGTIGALQARMASGDLPDVLVVMAAAMTAAQEQGLIAAGSSVEIGRTGLAVVVRQGAPAPDIASSSALRQALLAARSLAYTDPRTGAASGVAVADIIARLGIADRLKDKTVLVGGGPVGEVVARGDAELGIQQVTELLPVKGITVLPAFPADLQRVTVYRAAPLRRSPRQAAAAKLLGLLTGPTVQQRFVDAGFGRY